MAPYVEVAAEVTVSPGECPLCGAGTVALFLVRSAVPVHQNLLMDDPESARAVRRGSLELVVCRACGFIFNRAFEAEKLSYGDRYENSQDCSPAFSAHMDALAAQLAADLPRGARVVELGCGKGSFLRRLVAAIPDGRGIGFDPSYVGPDEDLGGRVRFERAFFDERTRVGDVDAVVCRHVIEHVPAPMEMLRSLHRALADSPGALVCFETPSVEWILRNRVIWDFFYEHCSYFSPGSLRYAFSCAGFDVRDVRGVFAGQHMWLRASRGARQAGGPDAGDTAALAAAFAADYDALVERWRRRVETLASDGRVAAWGAGAKGVTLAYLVVAVRALLDCIIDLNPAKQGRFAPGTGHPIVDPRTAAVRGVRIAVLMNPNYMDENAALIARERLPLELVA
jgi:SAM-dependent methyltransferase